ncbi:HAMP domain-containing sensor histidine kinase [Paenibacillus kandeliae]|uniref:HAMP domain-containing sensor histidine kinase n=1 Tax=Paenibacillus kandeliae TaxID=3231269 RepID=UPI00345781F6
MIPRRLDTLGWRMTFYSLVAIGCAAAIVFAGYVGARMLLWFHPPLPEPALYINVIRWCVNNIGFGPVMILCFIPFYMLFLHRFSRPLLQQMRQLSNGMSMVADGNTAHRLPVSSNDELGRLSSQLNHMLDQLQHAMNEERTALQSQNHLITSVSHDLRTPLTSIIGFLGYVESDRYRDEIELRHYVHIAYEKSRTMQKLLEDLLDYTRITYHAQPLQCTNLNVVQLLEQLTEECVPMLEEAGMEYHLTSSSPVLMVSGNGEELVRLFENVISNAVRYGSSGHWLDIQLEQRQGQIMIRFTNYGQPIPPEALPYLFDRFYRADAARSGYSNGSGLGLAIVKSIVERHHGSVSVQSHAAETYFDIALPVASS